MMISSKPILTGKTGETVTLLHASLAREGQARLDQARY